MAFRRPVALKRLFSNAFWTASLILGQPGGQSPWTRLTTDCEPQTPLHSTEKNSCPLAAVMAHFLLKAQKEIALQD